MKTYMAYDSDNGVEVTWNQYDLKPLTPTDIEHITHEVCISFKTSFISAIFFSLNRLNL